MGLTLEMAQELVFYRYRQREPVAKWSTNQSARRHSRGFESTNRYENPALRLWFNAEVKDRVNHPGTENISELNYDHHNDEAMRRWYCWQA